MKEKGRYHFDYVSKVVGGDVFESFAGRTQELFAQVHRECTRLGGLRGEAMRLAVMAQLSAFGSSPRQVFELEPGLVERLEQTKLTGITADMVGLPYPTFYLHVQNSGVTLESQRTDERMGLTGVYLHEDGDVWWITALSHGQDHAPVQVTWMWGAGEWFTSGLDFDAYIEKVYGDGGELREETALYHGTLRLLLHTLLYLSSSEADVEDVEPSGRAKARKDLKRFQGTRREERARERLARHTSAKIARVGGSFTPFTEGIGGQGSTPRVHWVRGHWKRVWSGVDEGRVSNVRWIQPYRRGSGEAEHQVRVYRVEGVEEE